MKIVPASIEQHINRVDRQRALVIGICCGLLAIWSIYRVMWPVYLSMTYNFLFASLVFQIVVWGAIGVLAVIAATGFLTRYAKAPEVADTNEMH